jgi:hypothetical protein
MESLFPNRCVHIRVHELLHSCSLPGSLIYNSNFVVQGFMHVFTGLQTFRTHSRDIEPFSQAWRRNATSSNASGAIYVRSAICAKASAIYARPDICAKASAIYAKACICAKAICSPTLATKRTGHEQ